MGKNNNITHANNTVMIKNTPTVIIASETCMYMYNL